MSSDDDGTTLGELLPDGFVDEHTDFSSTDELLSEAGLIADTPADHHTLVGGEFEQFVDRRTSFESWAEMRKTAKQRNEKGGM